mmetsp:Transcript_36883/g.118488  ORF Transcript_36883/g.118488 Transcript_36883/m.118488 type:complete len:83 (+) Transcript_36883:260-508(+)
MPCSSAPHITNEVHAFTKHVNLTSKTTEGRRVRLPFLRRAGGVRARGVDTRGCNRRQRALVEIALYPVVMAALRTRIKSGTM